MGQITFSEAEYQNKKRKTRREIFLKRMDKLIPWKQLEKKVARYYPKIQNGRPPYPLSAMLRVHCMQLFYNLSDPAMEDALYEIESMRQFAGLKLDRLPDETTILNFRHFLEQHVLGKVLFKEENKHLEKNGLMLREGSIVDATIISAPSSTKNSTGKHDPEMHQTKKGNEWHFGMKMHIGVDDTLGLIHSIDTTAANVHDIVPTDKLKAEKIKASVRAKVEHPFRYIKQVFGYNKVRYRGLAKNNNRLHLLAAFSNLLIGERYMLAQGQCACFPPKWRETGKKYTNNGRIVSESSNFCRLNPRSAKISGYSDLP